MKHASHGLRFEPQDLRDPQLAIEALAHWDELDPSSLALLEQHPVHGPRLVLLRAADAWLAESAAAARAARAADESRAVWETSPIRPVVGDRERRAGDDARAADDGRGCPRAEDLYDYGRGPGYAPLTPALRASIDRHLASCRRCEILVETLTAPPPAPLELDADTSAAAIGVEIAHDEHETERVAAAGATRGRLVDERGVANHAIASRAISASDASDATTASANPASDRIERRTELDGRLAELDNTLAKLDDKLAARARNGAVNGMRGEAPRATTTFAATRSTTTFRARRWVPLAAAAALVAGASLWFAWNASESKSLRFPESPLLRGTTTGSLLFPREHVLLATPELIRIWPALGQKLAFEIQPDPAAQSYWIEVSKHDGSAFAANETVWKETSTTPAITAKSELPAGHYTWEAWMVVHGLDQQLGRRDFDVVDDAGLRAQLTALETRHEPERSLAAVRLLHENGYRTDARRIARAMPASPERDAYLAEMPGR